MKKIIILVIPILLLTGCCNDTSYNTAKCNGEEYDIVSITRWSHSNYELELKDGNKIEVHPMNCIFYNNK
jgi:hypothetical protein